MLPLVSVVGSDLGTAPKLNLLCLFFLDADGHGFVYLSDLPTGLWVYAMEKVANDVPCGVCCWDLFQLACPVSQGPNVIRPCSLSAGSDGLWV